MKNTVTFYYNDHNSLLHLTKTDENLKNWGVTCSVWSKIGFHWSTQSIFSKPIELLYDINKSTQHSGRKKSSSNANSYTMKTSQDII